MRPRADTATSFSKSFEQVLSGLGNFRRACPEGILIKIIGTATQKPVVKPLQQVAQSPVLNDFVLLHG